MKKQKIIIFWGSMLYPIYFLPYLIRSIIKNELFGYILLAFFLGILAYLMIPYDTMDIVRYYDKFEIFKYTSFQEIFEYGRNVDHVIYIYIWSIANIGLPKEFIPFSITFVTYSLYFLSFYKVINFSFFLRKNLFLYSEKELSLGALLLIVFLMLINQIRFMDVASGLRNALAFSLFTYSFISYFLLNYRLLLFIFFSILAVSIHASVVILFIVLLLSIFVNNLSIFRKMLMLCYVVLLLGLADNIFYYVVYSLEPILREFNLYYPSYFDPDGVWGAGYYNDANMNTIIFEKYIKPLPLYLSGLYFILVNKYTNEKFSRFLIVLFIVVVLMSISRTIFDRLGNIYVVLFILFFTLEVFSKKIGQLKKLFLILFIGSLILMSFASVYKYRDIYWLSWKDVLFLPVPMLFFNEVDENKYIIRNGAE
ncbi:EpsG family protein [[Pasteurella] aerogenes]|nr:EpsG family protein [[Pasteurella] aerogenes]